MKAIPTILAFILTIASADDVYAAKGMTVRAARELVEAAARKSSTRTLSRLLRESPDQLVYIARRYGDDGLLVVSRHGRPALRVLANASDDAGAPVLRMIQRHGDDAVRMGQSPQGVRILAMENDTVFRVMHQTNGQAYPLLERYGPRAADAMANLTVRESRQLIQLQRQRFFSETQFRQIVDVVGEYGARGLDFVWEHKGALAVAAVFTAFITNPEPFIDGTKDITGVVVGTGGRLAGQVATGVVQAIDWNFWVGVLLSVLGAKVLIRKTWQVYLRRRAATQTMSAEVLKWERSE